MINTDTTITDKRNFSVSIIDAEKYSKLTQEEKTLFESLRNSVLEIFPIVDGKYDNLSLKFAENFAFIQLKSFALQTENLNKRIQELETQINTLLTNTTTTLTTEIPGR